MGHNETSRSGRAQFLLLHTQDWLDHKAHKFRKQAWAADTAHMRSGDNSRSDTMSAYSSRDLSAHSSRSRPNKKSFSLKKAAGNTAAGYSAASSVHGIQYAGEAGEPWIARGVWLLIVLSFAAIGIASSVGVRFIW